MLSSVCNTESVSRDDIGHFTTAALFKDLLTVAPVMLGMIEHDNGSIPRSSRVYLTPKIHAYHDNAAEFTDVLGSALQSLRDEPARAGSSVCSSGRFMKSLSIKLKLWKVGQSRNVGLLLSLKYPVQCYI